MEAQQLHIRDLTVVFDGNKAVDNVSFSLPKGKLLLISGDNGSGKTTLLNLISGLIKPTEGDILFNNSSIVGLSPIQIAQTGIIRLFQTPRIFKEMTVFDNLMAAIPNHPGENLVSLIKNWREVSIFEKKKKAEVGNILLEWDLVPIQNEPAGNRSYGIQKLISFCMILLQSPALILLDEPFAGMNPILIEKMSQKIQEMKLLGHTFIVVEHHIDKVLPITDFQLKLNAGKIIETSDVFSL